VLEILKKIDFIKEKKLNITKIDEKTFSLKNSKEKYILNLFPYGKYVKIKRNYECLKTISIEFKDLLIYEEIGVICDKICYRIIKDIKDEKKSFNQEDSYKIGFEIGKFINRFHKYFQSEDCGRWYKHYNYRINRLLHEYGLGKYRGELDYIIFDFLEENKYCLKDRTCTTIMGIDSICDIIISKNKKFQILEEYKILRSDSFFEFRNMNLNYKGNECLLTGIINGYFNGKVPRNFFKLLGVYTITENLYGIFSKYDQVGFEYINNKIKSIIDVYDGFSNIYPIWYLKNKKF
jgi:hypothetical protein